MKTWLFVMMMFAILFSTTTVARADLCPSCQRAGRDQCCGDRGCREVCRKTDRAPILGGGVNVLGFRLGGSFDLNRTRTGVECQDGRHCKTGYGLGVRADFGLPAFGGGESNCRTHRPACPLPCALPPRRPSCSKPIAPMPPSCAVPRRPAPIPQRECCGGRGCLDCQPERYSWLANYGRGSNYQFSGYEGQQRFAGGDRSVLVPASQPMPYRRLVTVPTYDPTTRTTGFRSYYRHGVE